VQSLRKRKEINSPLLYRPGLRPRPCGRLAIGQIFANVRRVLPRVDLLTRGLLILAEVHLEEVDMAPSPLGETLRKARLERNITFEDAERVTRIPRKYLEALELENFGILPAPVYARGFLRSYASYLGLEPKELLPFFPVGHVEEPTLDPLPEVSEPRTWNPSSLIAIGVVGALVTLVIARYALGRETAR
jgi:hypothetical protein